MKPKKPIDFSKCPIRTCRHMHECCLCMEYILGGQRYHDGGYGRHAHVECVEDTDFAAMVREANEAGEDNNGQV